MSEAWTTLRPWSEHSCILDTSNIDLTHDVNQFYLVLSFGGPQSKIQRNTIDLSIAVLRVSAWLTPFQILNLHFVEYPSFSKDRQA